MAERLAKDPVRSPAIWLGLAGLALTVSPLVLRPAPRFLWNASASAPVGLYAVSPGATFGVGDLVAAWPPARVREFAANRHYLPRNVPLVKRVAAVSPSTICAAGPRLFVDGRFAAYRLARDGQGRAMPWWPACRALRSGEFLLLMGTSEASFDGRYFGPSLGSDIIGPARPLWVR